MEYPIEKNAPDPTWSDSLVDILKRSLFSKDKGEAEAFDLPEQPNDPSIQWSDVGDIWENFLKKSASRAVDFPLKPFELLSGRDLSADIGVPGVEDWDMDYRDRFETGPYGWLRHLDKASYGSGILSTAAAYYALGRIPGLSKIAPYVYPGWRYMSDLAKMNKVMKMKKILENAEKGIKIPEKRGIWNAIKEFGKTTGQFFGRPVRHVVTPKRWSKKFDKFDPKIYEKAPGKPGGFPVSEKLFSLPERSLGHHMGIKYGAIGAADIARSLIREAKADEMDIDVPRGIETAYPDRIMRMAQTKDPTTLEVTVPLRYTQ